MLGAAALTGVLVSAPPAAADAVAPDLARFYDQEPTWKPCTGPGLDGLECAKIVVPMDYDTPRGEKIRVAISRHKAADRDHRRGILLVNPGGPGGSGLGLPSYLGRQKIGEVYDLIGFDPRGVGQSTQLRCTEPDLDDLDLPTRPTSAELHNYTEWARRTEEGCDRTAGSLRPHITTANTARDMDVIRGVLGEKKANYLGYSYGTYLGAVYGSLFPERLDRSVLDSSIHPDRVWRGTWLAMARAHTENVERFTEWAADHDAELGLGDTPEAVFQTMEDVAQRLHENPVDGFDRSSFDQTVFALNRNQGGWDVLAGVISSFREGDSAEAKEAARAGSLRIAADRARLADGGSSTFTTIRCEADWPKGIGGYYADMREYTGKYAYGLGGALSAPDPCTFRSYTPDEKPVELKRDGYPTGIVVQGHYDTQTAWAGGPAMAKRLRDSLIIVENDSNHGYYGGPDYDCVTEQIDDYLIDGILPGSATTCPGKPLPDLTAADAADEDNLTEKVREQIDEEEEQPAPAVPAPVPAT
ncbi:alpha/beta hydrolase [Nocardiopsis rhodophaea]|uniref:Alpha/beta hydrolase n=1 Tax=Nocardiopsis rhodophaea TaxID=280238 RepID=A0ABN2T7M1_9ACTN